MQISVSLIFHVVEFVTEMMKPYELHTIVMASNLTNSVFNIVLLLSKASSVFQITLSVTSYLVFCLLLIF